MNHLGKQIEVEAANADDKDKAELGYLGVQCLRPQIVSKLR